MYHEVKNMERIRNVSVWVPSWIGKKNPEEGFPPFPGFIYSVNVDTCLGMNMSQTRAIVDDEVSLEK